MKIEDEERRKKEKGMGYGMVFVLPRWERRLPVWVGSRGRYGAVAKTVVSPHGKQARLLAGLSVISPCHPMMELSALQAWGDGPGKCLNSSLNCGRSGLSATGVV